MPLGYIIESLWSGRDSTRPSRSSNKFVGTAPGTPEVIQWQILTVGRRIDEPGRSCTRSALDKLAGSTVLRLQSMAATMGRGMQA